MLPTLKAEPAAATVLRSPSALALLAVVGACVLLCSAAEAVPSRRAARDRRVTGRATPSHPHAASPAKPVELEKAALEFHGLKGEEDGATAVRVLQSVRGVESAIVDVKTGLAVVNYDPCRTGLPKLLTACGSAGLTANEYRVADRFPKPIKLKGS